MAGDSRLGFVWWFGWAQGFSTCCYPIFFHGFLFISGDFSASLLKRGYGAFSFVGGVEKVLVFSFLYHTLLLSVYRFFQNLLFLFLLLLLLLLLDIMCVFFIPTGFMVTSPFV